MNTQETFTTNYLLNKAIESKEYEIADLKAFIADAEIQLSEVVNLTPSSFAALKCDLDYACKMRFTDIFGNVETCPIMQQAKVGRFYESIDFENMLHLKSLEKQYQKGLFRLAYDIVTGKIKAPI